MFMHVYISHSKRGIRISKITMQGPHLSKKLYHFLFNINPSKKLQDKGL